MNYLESKLLNQYNEKYGTPTSKEDELQYLVDIYKEIVTSSPITLEMKEAIAEQYYLMESKGLPAYLWLMEAFHSVSRKAAQKRNLNYCIGMIRYWEKWGFKQAPAFEEKQLMSIFEDVAKVEMSLKARTVLQELMGIYGAISVTKALVDIGHSNNSPFDEALIKINILKQYMGDKFPTSEQFVEDYED